MTPAAHVPTSGPSAPRPARPDDALGWAADRLRSLGTPPTGAPHQVRARPWSTVHRIPVDGGAVWLKESGGRTGYEAALTDALAGWVPDMVLTPLATEGTHGWLLLPDGGTPLREGADGTNPRVWSRFVRQYAQLQRTVAPRADELLRLGVPDQRPTALPALLDGLLDDPAVPIEEPVRTALRRLRPRFADACAELADGVDGLGGLPVTVQHDDLHDGNVLPASGPGGRDRFFDWGDAAVAHPFGTLLVTLRSMAASSALAPDDPALRAVRDAYLAGWELEGPAGVRTARLAAWTGCVGRALAWQRALAGTGTATAWAEAVPRWVGELLEPTPAWFEPDRSPATGRR